MLDLDEMQAGIKISGRNINNLRYADDTTLMAEKKKTNRSTKEKQTEVYSHMRCTDPGALSNK